MAQAEDFIARSDAGARITLSECEAFLNSVPSFTDKHSIEETGAFLEFLGNPNENMKIIHVAGTNGKGSVCSYLSSILNRAGYTAGMFTSPHLVSINERYAVDGKPISGGVFSEVFVEVLKRIKEYDHPDYFPTYFEFLFFIAMLLYDVYPVDYLIMETGLGGRLDSTNTVQNPILTIITEIGYDHMEYLGNTLEEIAFEKAGIIKKNVPVIVFDKRPETTAVIKKTALEHDSRLITVSDNDIEDIAFDTDDTGNKYIAFSYKSLYDKYVDLRLASIARYQTQNASVAVAAAEILRQQGADIAEDDIRNGLILARWSGRMEEISPGIFIDGAHNSDGIDAFLESVSSIECSGRKILLFGMVGDKNYREAVQKILESGEFNSVYAAVLESSRSLSLSNLKSAFSDCKDELGIMGLPIKYYTNVRDAVTDIIAVRKSADYVFVAGSLYLAGEIKSVFS